MNIKLNRDKNIPIRKGKCIEKIRNIQIIQNREEIRKLKIIIEELENIITEEKNYKDDESQVEIKIENVEEEQNKNTWLIVRKEKWSTRLKNNIKMFFKKVFSINAYGDNSKRIES